MHVYRHTSLFLPNPLPEIPHSYYYGVGLLGPWRRDMCRITVERQWQQRRPVRKHVFSSSPPLSRAQILSVQATASRYMPHFCLPSEIFRIILVKRGVLQKTRDRIHHIGPPENDRITSCTVEVIRNVREGISLVELISLHFRVMVTVLQAIHDSTVACNGCNRGRGSRNLWKSCSK